MFFYQLFIGAILVCVTVVIHAVILDRIMVFLEKIGKGVSKVFGRFWKIPMLVVASLGAFFSHILQIWLWAIFYLKVDAFQNLATPLYFSTNAFTTVGFGDIVLDVQWQLLGSFQAGNGFLLFGWSTAFIFEVMSRLYRQGSFAKGEGTA